MFFIDIFYLYVVLFGWKITHFNENDFEMLSESRKLNSYVESIADEHFSNIFTYIVKFMIWIFISIQINSIIDRKLIPKTVIKRKPNRRDNHLRWKTITPTNGQQRQIKLETKTSFPINFPSFFFKFVIYLFGKDFPFYSKLARVSRLLFLSLLINWQWNNNFHVFFFFLFVLYPLVSLSICFKNNV